MIVVTSVVWAGRSKFSAIYRYTLGQRGQKKRRNHGASGKLFLYRGSSMFNIDSSNGFGQALMSSADLDLNHSTLA
jgi:hypothetical protein